MSVQLYEVSPRVVPADEVSQITFRGLYIQSDFRQLKGKITADYIGADGCLLDGSLPGITMGNGYDLKRPYYSEIPLDFDSETGTVKVKLNFRGEGEHTIRILCDQRLVIAFDIYSLNADLFDLRPFRGDMHLHSRFSGCNKDKASPEFFAASNSAIGNDFISISDHKQLEPSRIAMAFTQKCGGNLHAYPGEEVHLSDLHNHHLLNFGGNTCISEFLKNEPEKLAEELKPYYNGLPADIDERLRQLMATGDYLSDKIKQNGGLPVLCHPFWKPHNRFFLPTPVLDYMCKNLKFDAIELLGMGCVDPLDREMNKYSIALWHDLCIRAGRQIPVVGNNDAHMCSRLGLNCSVVFAPKNTCTDIITAVRANHSVAIDQTPGEFPSMFGDRRLVQFTYFLYREFYPAHDEICRRESKLMFSAISKSEYDPEGFAAVKADMAAFMSSFWKA